MECLMMNGKGNFKNNIGWCFDNTYSTLPDAMLSKLAPVPVKSPKLVILNKELSKELDLNFSSISIDELTAMLAGNLLPEGSESIAQAYAGHQFGHFTMLGDGRAITLGEHIDRNGERFDIQFKGSGKTPYSRQGDGKAALGPMLREYIISESMDALHIPSSRSLAVVATGEPVYREKILAGAVLTRVASSHIRVGTFEYAAARHDIGALTALVNYAINRHYRHLNGEEVPALALLNTVIKRQVNLIVDWMRVGFVHGVMNTDNMTISGETIDYGPCAFMDTYDEKTVFSSIDQNRRYAFGNQPHIAQWNIARFAEALLPLLDANRKKAIDIAEEQVFEFIEIYNSRWLSMMRKKLGLETEKMEDKSLINKLLQWMQNKKADYTNTFRLLSDETFNPKGIYKDTEFIEWYTQWQARRSECNRQKIISSNRMNKVNPTYIPRNYQVELALYEAVENDNLSAFKSLVDLLKTPYTGKMGFEEFEKPSPDYFENYQTYCGT